MTARELIEQLQEIDLPNAEVVIEYRADSEREVREVYYDSTDTIKITVKT